MFVLAWNIERESEWERREKSKTADPRHQLV